MHRLRLALCQLDTTVGDLDGNVAKVLAALADAEAQGADLAVFPELTVTGYPPEDLLLKPTFVAANRAALDKIVASTGRCVAIIGFVEAGRTLANAAAVCSNGVLHGVYAKQELPNYAVFDELRHFTPGSAAECLYEIAGVRVGVSICEDAWNPVGAIAAQAAGGADVVVSLNASPYAEGRQQERERTLATRAADASCAVAYVNLVGGQDELVFDGGSFVVDGRGELVTRLPRFVEQVTTVDVEIAPVFRARLLDPRGRGEAKPLPVVAVTDVTSEVSEPAGGGAVLRGRSAPEERCIVPELDPDAEVYAALVTGTRDYVCKNGFNDVVVGLSGGIDSSLVATIAVDALGSDHVHGVAMPSRFSSDHSLDDARDLAARLGIDFREVPIEAAHASFLEMLAPTFADRAPDLTEENLQSRIRGVVLMALSNKFGWLVLTTGNKSESAVGYSTLYGDTAGAFAVIRDVYKTRVYDLCRWRNRSAGRELIPEHVLTKPPSAELRPDQLDADSLPPYPELDAILRAHVEEDATVTDLLAMGFDEPTVRRVVRLVGLAEYKRRQSPPGPRVTAKAFGKDRRLPITNGFPG